MAAAVRASTQEFAPRLSGNLMTQLQIGDPGHQSFFVCLACLVCRGGPVVPRMIQRRLQRNLLGQRASLCHDAKTDGIPRVNQGVTRTKEQGLAVALQFRQLAF